VRRGTQRLGDQPFLLEQSFSVADAYQSTILGWTKHGDIDLARWPVPTAYAARIAERPAVRAALAAEGL